MAKDERYRAARGVIEQDDLQLLSQVFKVIPKTIVAKDLGLSASRLNDKLNQIEKFTLKEVFAMATLFEVDSIKIFELASAQYEKANGLLPSKHVLRSDKSFKKRLFRY